MQEELLESPSDWEVPRVNSASERVVRSSRVFHKVTNGFRA